jgi:hypothetical protein
MKTIDLSVTLFVALANWAGTSLAAGPQPDTASPAATLRRYQIEPTTAGVLRLLGQWQPTAENRARATRLVSELGSGSYPTREAASQQLGVLGASAETALREAVQASDELEVVVRARRLLADCSGEELLVVTLRWLRQSPTPQATPLLLGILPAMPDAFHEAACEALWACASPGDATQLRKAVGDASTAVRRAAIPAFELAAGEAAVGELKPFLRDKDEAVRLAAARALIDRSPQPSIAALLGLLESADAGVRCQAAWLLQQVSDVPGAGPQPADFTTAAAQWKAWAGSAAAQHPRTLGLKRLQFAGYGTILLETFAADMAEIGRTYHHMHYQTDVGGKASVAGGMLRLDGNHAEGDQRLYATAETLLGAKAFPRRFRIKAKLGGEAQDAGAWHVGVSVGNIRLLFHPGFSGGQFRAERVDNHDVVKEAVQMPFTPAAGILHEMIIDVAVRDNGSVRFDVLLADGAGVGRRFQSSATVRLQDIGPVERIGLERSGRMGGAGLFGPFSIQNAWLAEK